MSLGENVFCTTEEVWTYLNPSDEDRDNYEGLMEIWLNAASYNLEGFLHRPVKHRRFDDYQDGNDRKSLLVDNYPISSMHTIEVFTGTTYIISPLRENRECVIDYRCGLITLLYNAPLGCWPCGRQNVHLVYEAGFYGYELDAFKPVIFETVETYYRDMGANPRLQQLSESIGNSYFTGRFDPSKMSHQAQMIVQQYGRIGV